jgi:hypothetical protein
MDDEYNERLALILKYAEFIANTTDTTSKCILTGKTGDDIDTLKNYIQGLLPHFEISEKELTNFAILLNFDYSLGTYNSHIWCLTKCLDKLASFSKLSKAEIEAFLA